MTHVLLRWTVPIALLIATIGGTTGAVTAQDVRMQSLPIQVLDCETNPRQQGDPVGVAPKNPEQHGCTPADGVAVTLHSAEYDWHARCDTDARGECEIRGPAGPDIVLTGAVYLATVTPGLAPVEPIFETIIYTEFAAAFLVNLPIEGDGEIAGRQVLSVNAAGCADGSAPDAASCTRVPTDDTLVKVTETTGKPVAGEPWLAPNAEGWVSFDIGPLKTETLTMLVDHPGDVRFACTDLDSGERLQTEDPDPAAGDTFAFSLIPISDGDIRCDITLLGISATPTG